MRRAAPFLLLTALAAPLALPRDAGADWPPAVTATPADLSQPSNWPNDPGYGIASPTDSGQWNFWSWTPQSSLMLPGFHTEEAALGAGNNIDMAWALTIGDPNVLIAVTDSGIEWDERDLQFKFALNTGELSHPRDAAGNGLPFDANGDGVFSVADYANDARVPCGTALPHPMGACHGADGMNNDPNGNGLLDPGDLIRVFSDGVDDDGNGYTDDISGWDFFKDDNDPYDDTRYGHGTGESKDSSAETNNGVGGAGVCPLCRIVPLRVGDSFSTDVNDFAQAAVYAADARYGTGRVRIINDALGAFDNSGFAMDAIDYAHGRGVAVIASAADENSRHHNFPSTNNHTIVVHAIRYNGNDAQHSTTYMAFNNCTNYGAELQLSVAGNSCSSEATGKGSGIAGLILSEALARNLNPELTPEELRQLLIGTVDDVNVPTSQPGAPNYDSTLYPSLPGFDQRFGYGRTNARRAVERVRDGKIPPEVDIDSPRWFTVFNPDRTNEQHLRIGGRIAAVRAPSFDYVVEWAPGVEPQDGAWHSIRQESAVTAPVTDMLADLDLSDVQVDNPGELENRYTITVRVRATAHYMDARGDVTGEARRAFYVRRDATVAQGFPLDIRASGESSPHLADLNGDGRREIVFGDADGFLHAVQSDGTELAGFPAHTNLDRGFDPARTPVYLASPAYASAAIDATRRYEAVVAGVAIGDLDGDQHPEIVVASYHGTVYAFSRDGTPFGHGFPRGLPDVPSSMNDPQHKTDRGIMGAPTLVDLDHDTFPEIVFGAFDGRLYALDGRTAMDKPGFPVTIHNPAPGSTTDRIVASVSVGKFDGDDVPDLVVESNEFAGGDEDWGEFYIVHGDGNNHAGGAFFPNFPIGYQSAHLLPIIGEGLSSTPAVADVNGDGLDEVAISGATNATPVILGGTQGPQDVRPMPSALNTVAVPNVSGRGPLSDTHVSPATLIPTFGFGSFGDMTNEGVLTYVLPGGDVALAGAASGWRHIPFEHLLGAWNARTGAVRPGFPQVMEDFAFFGSAVIADVSNDGYAEAIIGTGGYYLHAWDACGREASGFPKFTGQWIASVAAVGDLDNDSDHTLETVAVTRDGWLWAWHTDGRASGSVQWPTARHDNANTGNYGTPLDFGTRQVTGTPALQCPSSRPPADGGVPDDGGADGGADGGMGADGGPMHATGGCGCRTAGEARGGARGGAVIAAVAAMALLAGARRRRGNSLSPRGRS